VRKGNQWSIDAHSLFIINAPVYAEHSCCFLPKSILALKVPVIHFQGESRQSLTVKIPSSIRSSLCNFPWSLHLDEKTWKKLCTYHFCYTKIFFCYTNDKVTFDLPRLYIFLVTNQIHRLLRRSDLHRKKIDIPIVLMTFYFLKPKTITVNLTAKF
jgi:hypothetical protein